MKAELAVAEACENVVDAAIVVDAVARFLDRGVIAMQSQDLTKS